MSWKSSGEASKRRTLLETLFILLQPLALLLILRLCLFGELFLVPFLAEVCIRSSVCAICASYSGRGHGSREDRDTRGCAVLGRLFTVTEFILLPPTTYSIDAAATLGPHTIVMNPLLDGGTDYGQNVVFPLPYRILLLLGLGILGWASNLHVLDALEVDAVQALDLRTEDTSAPVRLPVTQRDHANSSRAHTLIRTTYKVFLAYSLFCTGSWIVYRFKTKGDPSLVDSYGHIPVITACLLLLAVFCPFDLFYKTERDKFVQYVISPTCRQHWR